MLASRVWWCTLLISDFRRQRQEDLCEIVAQLFYVEFQAIQGCVMKLCLNKPKTILGQGSWKDSSIIAKPAALSEILGSIPSRHMVAHMCP